jgi:hypothetical protein
MTGMSRNGDDFRDWLDRIRKEIRKQNKAISRLKWTGENLESSVEEQVQIRRSDTPKKSRKTVRAIRPGTAAARRSNSRYVRDGVTQVVIEHDADGWMHVHIENIGLPVLLRTSQRLLDLLRVLCGKVSRVNKSEDGVVPYKTIAEIREAIKVISGTDISVGYLQNLIQQLRDLLVAAQLDPGLIETGRCGEGYRFRLQLTGNLHEVQR